jgi:hypothetical protein
MREREQRAERYRREANRYAELAKDSDQPEFLIKLYRQTAIRYVLMAEDVENCLEQQGSFHRQDRRSLWARARAFMEPA